MVDQRGFGDSAGFVRDSVLLVNDAGRITPQWYRALTDLYQASGLAGVEYPMWNDLVIPSLSMRVPAAGGPGLSTFQGGTVMPAFDAATSEELFFCIQFPHQYVGGTTLYPFVHWSPSDAAAGDVRWVLEYTIAQVGGDFATTSSATLDATASGVAFKHQFIEGAAIEGRPDAASGPAKDLRFSAVLAGRIYRDAPAAEDTYGSDAFLLSAGLHAMHGVPGTHQARTPA